MDTQRLAQARPASGNVAQGELIPGYPATSEAGPELLEFSVEISNRLVWSEFCLSIKVREQARSSWPGSKASSAGRANDAS